MKLVDGRGRTVEYLRLSLTERCNLACSYCVPQAHHPQPADWMTDDEVVALVSALLPLGVRRVRLTGGEPTLRPRLPQLVERLAGLGLHDLALTTNGTRLQELAGPLFAAGLHRINVSLDTLRADRFAATSGERANLAQVRAGIAAMRDAGFARGKLNTVALRGINEDELPALARFAWEHDLVPRFIELMPMSDGSVAPVGQLLAAATVRERLSEAFGPLRATEGSLPGVGPARYLTVEAGAYAGRQLGVIAAVTERFCESCNRIRISARGRLHACLGLDDPGAVPGDRLDLRAALLDGPAVVRARVQRALAHKAEGHAFTVSARALTGGPRRHMIVIGG
jgi:cyclic pyranopterin phosphate synthase